MIDRTNRIIYNGYGSNALVCHGLQTIRVIHFDPSKAPGEAVADEDLHTVFDTVDFKLDREQLSDLLSQLSAVTPENPTFELDGWTVDFSQFDPQSVRAWSKAVCRLLHFFILPLAC